FMYNKVSEEQEKYIRKIKRRKKNITITQILILVVWLFLWEVAAKLGWIDTFLTSSPSEVWKLFIEYTKNGNLFYHVGISVTETIIGFLIGTILGVLVAIMLWWSDFI
ncbi:hypothetical protein KUA25_30595, partial [Bacteroidales bacterium MSK.15.36]|nr:hypothetical protein [Bacteroidales bacterium MSK.15.36]